MATSWQFRPPEAQLHWNSVRATLNVSQPEQGLRDVQPFFGPASLAGFFQLQLAPGAVGSEVKLADAYVRLNDLIANYGETEARPFSVQIYWRMLGDLARKGVSAALELIVSTQTNLLDTHPQVATVTTLPDSEVYRLANDPAGTPFQLLAPETTGQTLTRETGTGCLLFRPGGANFSYAEMVHPVDFQNCELSCSTEGLVSARQSVISRWMEKGVIVRARLRGIFVDRKDDFATTAACYWDFCAAQAPLTV